MKKILTTLGAPLDVTKSTLPAISQNYPSFAHLLHQSLLSGAEYSINTPHFEEGPRKIGNDTFQASEISRKFPGISISGNFKLNFLASYI